MTDETQFFTTKKDIQAWLVKHAVSDYTIEEVKAEEKHLYYGLKWIVNAKDIFLFNENIGALPVCFGVVKGDFLCQFCALETLKGTPRRVEGHFLVRENNLTSLDFGPQIVLKDYLAANNDITRIGGENAKLEYVGGEFSIEQNPLQSIDYVAMEPDQYFKANLQITQKANDRVNNIVRQQPVPVKDFTEFYDKKGELKLTGAQYKSVCEKLSLTQHIASLNHKTKTIRKI